MNKPILFSLEQCMKCIQTKELLADRDDVDIVTYPHDINDWSDEELKQAKEYDVFEDLQKTAPILWMGEEKKITVELGDRGELLGFSTKKKDSSKIAKGRVIEGIEVADLDNKVKEKYGLDKKTSGIVVKKIEENSKFERVLHENDVILKLVYSGYQYNIDNVDTFEKYMEQITESKRAFIVVYARNGVRQSSVIR